MFELSDDEPHNLMELSCQFIFFLRFCFIEQVRVLTIMVAMVCLKLKFARLANTELHPTEQAGWF